MRSVPGIVSVYRPVGDPVPVVFDVPHSGTAFPDDFGCVGPVPDMRAGVDHYVDELFAAAPWHGATLVAAEFPRIYVDPNRSLSDIDVEMIDGAWPHPIAPTKKVATGRGLIWKTRRGGHAIYDRKLPVDEVLGRVDGYWRPYQETLDAAVEAAAAGAGGRLWHVNCHSMGPEWFDRHTGSATPIGWDFILGTRDGTTCAPEFRDLVAGTLDGMGYRVAIDHRFKGVELVRRIGVPARGRHSIQIEINHGLYVDPRNRERTDGFGVLQRDLGRLAETICAFARGDGR